MRYSLALVLVLAVFVACGGTSDNNSIGTDSGSPPGNNMDSSTGGPDAYSTLDTYVPPSSDTGTVEPGDSASTGEPTEGGGSCTDLKCTDDTMCQSACPAVTGGVYCCDTATQVCFPTSEAMCPSTTGGTDGGSMY
jgi:hypothetical protein